LYENRLDTNPAVVAELGPGDSFGVGLMALLTGSEKYYALDIVERAKLLHNVEVLDNLIGMLSNRVNIPNEDDFPKLHPCLNDYAFPLKIVTEKRVVDQLRDERIEQIREDLLKCKDFKDESSSVRYICPWHETRVLRKESVNMVYSQAVLEHVIDLRNAYQAMYAWLKKGGVMSHQVDFKSHHQGLSDQWNDHWAYSDFEWKLIKGKKSYEINREPLSTHLDLLTETGFKILAVIPVKDYPSDKYSGSIHRDQLAKKFQKMSEEDFRTCNAHILSIKE
jgi:hypothetical protein